MSSRTHASTRSWWALAILCLIPLGCQTVEDLVTRMFRTKEKSGRIVDGKQEGAWVYRYLPSGATKAKGNYRDDKQIGRWVYYYENGNVEWEGEFDEQRISGPSAFGYESGQRRAVGLFVNGLEEDLWTFWSSDGTIDQEGDFVRGQPAMRWAHFHRDGSLMAEGYRWDGERVGPWQFYTPSGELSERRFPMPDGIEIVHETWDGAVPRREGFLIDGAQSGRWITSHPNGRRRVTGDFLNGSPHGLWIAWTEEGAPIARGFMNSGRPVGDWVVWRNGVRETVPGDGLRLTTPFSGEWSTEGATLASSPERALEVWLSEATSPTGEVLNIAPDPNTPPPPSEYVTATEKTPEPPIRPQPWTVREASAMDFLVARYSDGARNVRAPRSSGYGRRSRRGSDPEKGGDPKLSPKFIGTELPWTRFFRGQGDVVDLDDYRGKKKVVLVVLRGLSREVCVYCVTQTEALCDYFAEFEKEDCAVFVVYPGGRSRLEAFMESFRTFTKRDGEPPIGVLYDRKMELIERMGIVSEFAIPSTFVIDENGKIRYSYVGTGVEDRPKTEDILEAVRAL